MSPEVVPEANEAEGVELGSGIERGPHDRALLAGYVLANVALLGAITESFGVPVIETLRDGADALASGVQHIGRGIISLAERFSNSQRRAN